MYRIGIDVGGTFTDVTLLNAQTGECHTYKLSSTPTDQSVAIMQGAKEILAQNGVQAEEVNYFGHGTTVATNMIIEKKGAKTALVTTKGFRDILEIGRQTRPSLYNLFEDKPETLIPRSLRKEIAERVNSVGAVLIEADADEIASVLERLKEENIEAIAVCLLFSYLNPDNENRVASCIKTALPGVYSSISSNILPEFREFERLSTTVINSYLGPKMKQYIHNLEKRVKDLGIPVEPYITQSNGGVMSIHSTIETPVQTALSGPSAGVVGAIYVSGYAGFTNLITYDMGGTSTDVSLVINGVAEYTTKRKICGLPSGVPMIDVHAVGAGGGSIAYIDSGGALKVGPESAGALPGPACYGLGGENPVVTDANLVLGRINPQYFLGGRMKIEAAHAHKAIKQKVADKLGLGVQQAAAGIVSVVNSNMARAIRVITVERGYNPSDFVLVAYGGAGPLHAVQLAQDMGIRKVLVPPSPGTLCALGLLTADIKKSYGKTALFKYDETTPQQLNDLFTPLMEQGNQWLASEKVEEKDRSFRNVVEMRYIGQNYELQVSVPSTGIDQKSFDAIREDFFFEHEKNYGYYNPNAPLQFVNFRSEAIGHVAKPDLTTIKRMDDLESARIGTRDVYFEAYGAIPCPVYERNKLGSIESACGPCIVEQMDSTTVIPPGTTFMIDGYGNIIISV